MGKNKEKVIDSSEETNSDVEGTFVHGIKIHQKKGIRVRGATIHLKVIPSYSGYTNDYDLLFEFPNKKTFSISNEHMTKSFSDVCEEIFLAATGRKPRLMSDKETYVVEGIPLKINVSDSSEEESIKPEESPDPTIVQTQPEKEETEEKIPPGSVVVWENPDYNNSNEMDTLRGFGAAPRSNINVGDMNGIA